MYKFERYRQIGLADFNQPLGLKMNPENRWVKKAETIPGDAIEERYAKLFPSKTVVLQGTWNPFIRIGAWKTAQECKNR